MIGGQVDGSGRGGRYQVFKLGWGTRDGYPTTLVTLVSQEKLLPWFDPSRLIILHHWKMLIKYYRKH
jgi:hypothetical protein